MILAALALLPVTAAEARSLTLWHAWRGDERVALDQLVGEWNAAHPDVQVETLAVPYEALSSKVSAAIPEGNGPDLFIYAHEKLGEWTGARLLAPVAPGPGFYPVTVDALAMGGQTWGWPLSYKCIGLFYNRALVPTPPASTDALLAMAPSLSGLDRWPLVYEVTSAYFNAAWLHGYGGGVFDADRVSLDRPANVAAFTLIQRLALDVLPADPSGALVTQLFNEGRAAMALNGPWFIGEIAPGVDYGVAPLPVVSATGLPAAPYVTVEAMFLGREGEDARAFGAWFSSAATAPTRLHVARQLVANADVPVEDPVLAAFAAELSAAVPMPNRPEMARTWEPLAQAYRRLARGSATPEQAAQEAQTTYEIVSRPIPPAVNPLPYAVAAILAAVAGAGWAARGIWQDRSAIARWRHAYAWVAPASIALGLLVLLPFLVGAAVSLFESDGADWRFVGVTQFLDILLARDFPLQSPLSFWFTLAVTILWTVANVTLHVGLGVALAMLLREPWVRMRGVFRALLILPWAIPSYITALAWKGMFHRQFGAINALLVALGLEPVSWFSKFSTSFAANVATNTWLGFPFMMVVTLGALQSIPRELEEAAEVDGASGWQRFRHVTLPLLSPALLPAVILGSVWTFNMFNVIYLVSGGEPDGTTDILISQAYRWAFTRGHRYGYAAAYAVIIFGAMLVQGKIANKLAGRRIV